MSTQSAEQPLQQVADLVHGATDVDFKTMAGTIARAILTPLASLRLTVILLVLAILVIWIATLEQTRYDIWQVKAKHFPALLVYIPFQTFFPPAWFGEMQEVPGGFYMPSGTLILVLMIANLAAAHLVRMRIQAKGLRLGIGLITMLAGCLLTWGVIFSGQNSDGFQGSPPVSYETMWTFIQVGLLGLAIGAGASGFLIEGKRLVERALLFGFAAISIAVLIFLFVLGKDSFIGDSAMRILWQLIQATIAALVLLAGCILVFKRKGGIVLVHLGIGMLMANELYVISTNVEQQMRVDEGQTVSYTKDIRDVELMVLAEKDNMHEMVLIPKSELLKNQIVSHEDLPFDIECVRYMINADVQQPKPGVTNIATKGTGVDWAPVELPRTNGLESDEVDQAAAYIRLIDKDPDAKDKELGIYMVSQEASRQDVYEKVEYKEQEYFLALRYKHIYKPYSITLEDVQKEDYPGTDTPKWYASEFVLHDHENNVSSNQRIWMNNPLRYGNETFYQSQYGRNINGVEHTVIQIVKNAGWMIPYVACMIVVVGLFAQFGATLLKFLEKAQAKKSGKSEVYQAELADKVNHDKGHSTSNFGWIAFLIFLIFASWVGMKGMKAARKTVVKDEMRLDLFGQIPVTFRGRVQPMESVSRNIVRQLSNREEVIYPDAAESIFGKKKTPAIQWIADVIYQSKGHDEVQILRIEDLKVIAALKLPTMRKGLKFTLAELREAGPKLDELVEECFEPDPITGEQKVKENLTQLQTRILEVRRKLNMIQAVGFSLRDPATVSFGGVLERLSHAARLVDNEQVPRAIYLGENEWLPYPLVGHRQWLREYAEELGETETEMFGGSVGSIHMIKPLQDELVKDATLTRILQGPELTPKLKELLGVENKEQVAAMFDRNWDNLPPEIIEQVVPISVFMEVDKRLRQNILPSMAPNFRQLSRSINAVNAGKPQIEGMKHESADALAAIQKAYREGDATSFNQDIEAYLAKVEADPPQGYESSVMKSEKFYNEFSPFYMSIVCYLVAIIFTLIGWIGFRPMIRAGYWMVGLAVSIHILGIILRIVISGRPPVTNLYSSFIFVSAAAVLIMMIVERMSKLGIGNILAAAGGLSALMWAWTISIRDGDTFTVLQAILDTQFWLSTHVICISLGYAATIAAGLVGIAYLVGGIFVNRLDKSARKSLVNNVYGITCFALFFSFFGTVLGGLWGDDSWGRFWGWDPKENGALMIVFWNAVLLHARWGGVVRERGMAGIAVFGIVVTLWSWEGVNMLGVGLHSYGFSEGKFISVLTTAVCVTAVSCLAFVPLSWWRSLADD